MRATCVATLTILAVISSAGAGQAQDLSKMCETARNVQVGQWAEYQMTGSNEGESARMRIAIIGTKDIAGKKAYWIEIKMKADEGNVITQVLTGGYPFETAQIHEMIVKAGDQPAMKMPSQAVAMMRNRIAGTPSLGAADKCDQAKVVGFESVTVPAGTFRAVHLKPADVKADVWALAEIPFGLIKSKSPEGEVVLVKQGKGAKSSITEKPLSIPGMGGF